MSVRFMNYSHHESYFEHINASTDRQNDLETSPMYPWPAGSLLLRPCATTLSPSYVKMCSLVAPTFS